MADPRLPTDMLIEVLIRLPVKFMLKFRCVSKSWRDLISSPVFIQRHLKYDRKQRVLLVKRCLPTQNRGDEAFSPSNPSLPNFNDLVLTSLNCRLPLPSRGLYQQNGGVQILSFHDPESPEVLVSPDLPISILNDLNIHSHRHSDIPIHGPCNGLVCIAMEETVFLCNPALREFKLLPPRKFPVGYIAIPLESGFGLDPVTGAYKVIQIWDIEHEVPEYAAFMLKNIIRIDLYNSASNSWKQIDAKVPDISYGSDLFFNSVIHWCALTASENYPCILCFDISTESFRQLDFHDNFSPPSRGMSLMVFNESLAMVRYSKWQRDPQEIEIWEMKEYGVKESWTKLFVVGPYCGVRPLLFLKNDWLLVESDNGRLTACALDGKQQFREFQFNGRRRSLSAVVYEESLVSLNQIISSDRKIE